MNSLDIAGVIAAVASAIAAIFAAVIANRQKRISELEAAEMEKSRKLQSIQMLLEQISDEKLDWKRRDIIQRDKPVPIDITDLAYFPHFTNRIESEACPSDELVRGQATHAVAAEAITSPPS
jgi:DNA primase large subunit